MATISTAFDPNETVFVFVNNRIHEAVIIEANINISRAQGGPTITYRIQTGGSYYPAIEESKMYRTEGDILEALVTDLKDRIVRLV